MSEYDYTEDDAKGGGSSNKAKPTGTYVTIIEGAETKKDKNGKLYAKFQGRIQVGPHKNGVIFENYLPLSNSASKFQVMRRNSWVKALGLKPGDKIPGTPGGPDIAKINGTYVDVVLEHEYENVPGQQYSVTTRKGKLPEGVTEADVAGIQPRETPVWWQMSDDFIGIGPDTDEVSAGNPWAD